MRRQLPTRGYDGDVTLERSWTRQLFEASGAGAGAGSPPPTPAPTVGSGVVAIGTSITGRLPGPVGTVAAQTLQSVGSTVDRVLPLSTSVAGSKLGLHLP